MSFDSIAGRHSGYSAIFTYIQTLPMGSTILLTLAKNSQT